MEDSCHYNDYYCCVIGMCCWCASHVNMSKQKIRSESIVNTVVNNIIIVKIKLVKEALILIIKNLV